MLKDFIPRLYQETILATANCKNTLVVLPTGMGKTGIALLLAIQRMKSYPNSKIVFLAPTKPLAEQHRQTFEKNLDIDSSELNVFTGFVKPEKRAELWGKSRIIFGTPQGLENDLISEKISLKEVSLMIFDEAHRATGDYSYNFIAKQYLKKADYPRILALTASPGSDSEKIEEICKNLGIEDVEIRTSEDSDVKPYVQKVDFIWESVELPEEFLRVKKFLSECFNTKIKEINNLGLLSNVRNVSKKELLMLQASIQARLAKGEKDFDMMRGLSVAAEAIKVQHALELLETQSIGSLVTYLDGIFSQASTSKTKAVQNLAKDVNFKSAFVVAQKLFDENVEHPKLSRLKEIVASEIKKESKILIFNNYRENASKIVDELKQFGNSVLFVGQTKKNGSGLSQKEQKEIIEKFRSGEYDIMVATSIGEEGLDIPKVDTVIFYEPIPSAIRQIQRRGRTGRNEKGKVVVLYAKNTRDEAYRWSAHHKEKRMNSLLKSLKGKLILKNNQKECLKDFIENDFKIIADYREKGNAVIKELMDSGIKIDLKHLETADYVISERIGVEYKTQKDFVDSIIDGRLLQQLKHIKDSFEKPIVVVEGSGDLFSQRNVHANAIRGMIATIIVSYSIPLVFTRDNKETAALFVSIAKRESGVSKDFSLHVKKPLNLKEQQEYLVSSFPSVGPSLAKELLAKFGSVKGVVNASEEELRKLEGVGEKIAKSIKEVADKEYNSSLKEYLMG